MILLDERLYFPPPDTADEHGLLALGGDLSEERLLLAYRSGIFPWYNEDEPICWWSPDPRCVLFPQKLKVSRSMRQVINRGDFDFRFNENFERVMRLCQTVTRKDQPGTWIQDEMVAAYVALHKKGYAVSAEAWQNGKLVGGLYGIKLGAVFFGESMFSLQPNASKFALINLLHRSEDAIKLVDCQMPSSHLMSLGAEMIARAAFIDLVSTYSSHQSSV